MSRFAELARLRKGIHKNRFECIGSMQEGVDFMCDAEAAMPWLLAIAEAFQPGDSERLGWIRNNYAIHMGDEKADMLMLERLQVAAEELER